MLTPKKRGAKIAKWLAEQKMREEEALIAEAMRHAAAPTSFGAVAMSLPVAPRGLDLSAPQPPTEGQQRLHNVAKASSAGDDDGPKWENHSKEWTRIAAGRAAPRAFESIPDEFNEIRVRVSVLDPCNGDVPICGGGNVGLWWRGRLADRFSVTSGYKETKIWPLGRDSYTGGGFEVRFDFIGVGDYEIEGRY